MTLGNDGATCFVGSGEGMGVERRAVVAFCRGRSPWVLRAGLVVRERVTLDLRCFFAATRLFFGVTARVFRVELFLVVGRAFLAVVRLRLVFFFTAFLERGAVAREREAPALEREVALERVLLAA